MRFDKQLITYDIETYYDTFLFTSKFWQQDAYQVFEIGWRKNQINELLQFLSYLKNIDAFMIGYNNVGFDWIIVQDLIQNPQNYTPKRAFDLAQKIIEGQKYGLSPIRVNLQDRIIHQVDLVKVWHFDNEAKRCRLKDLEFSMRLPNVMDLPFDFRKPMSSEQIDKLIEYNKYDVEATEKFAEYSMDRIQLRRDLLTSNALRGDVMNWNDTKIGEQFFMTKLGLRGRVTGTERFRVDFKNIILPKIAFRLPQFEEVLEEFKTKYWIKDDKDHNKSISFSRPLAGVNFKFGSGGVHASVEKKVYRSSATHKIIDVDVAGYYPAVGIVNKFYPEHLGEKFVDVYKQLKADRKQFPKGSAMNAVYKLAQNGTYGKSNSEYSPIYDIRYMFSITINGQLQLLQLAEMFSLIPGLEIIQANTDGITAYVPREYEWLFDMWKTEWQNLTGYELEQVEYKSMFIRDVNNYISVKMDDSVKRKGAYWHPESWQDYDEAAGHWHTDNSSMIVQKVAEQVMLHGYNPEFLLRSAMDPFDFMIRLKVIGGQKGLLGTTETQKTFRYYVSTQGQPLTVVRPAAGIVGEFKRKAKITDKLYSDVMKEIGMGVWDERIHTKNKSKYEDTVSSVVSGFKVEDCCLASNFKFENIDYKYYLEEVEKLLIKEQ